MELSPDKVTDGVAVIPRPNLFQLMGSDMPDITLGVHRGGASGVSHSPPKVKSTEQGVAYNPFWLDLSQEPTPLNPEGRMDGIVI